MPDMQIRRAAPADLPVLTRLWQAAFGDPPELIERFYRRFPPAKAAWVVEDGGCGGASFGGTLAYGGR